MNRVEPRIWVLLFMSLVTPSKEHLAIRKGFITCFLLIPDYFTYVPSIPSIAYLPQPTSGHTAQPKDQIQLNVISVTALTKVRGAALKPLTITLYLLSETLVRLLLEVILYYNVNTNRSIEMSTNVLIWLYPQIAPGNNYRILSEHYIVWI